MDALFDPSAMPTSSADDDLLFFFSSPTTDGCAPPPPPPTIPFRPDTLSAVTNAASTAAAAASDPFAHLSSIITAATSQHLPSGPLLPLPLAPPAIKAEVTLKPDGTVLPEPATPPRNSASRKQTQSSSDDDSAPSPRRSLARLGGKKRSLEEMHAVAKRNAPNASLADHELEQISRMHESDASLAESRQLYTSLVQFKKALATFGYRINSMYVDAAPREKAAESESAPFAFVLNKTPAPASTPAQAPDDQSDRSASGDELTAAAGVATGTTTTAAVDSAIADGAGSKKRQSVTMSNTDNSSGGGSGSGSRDGRGDGEPVRKRVRTGSKAHALWTRHCCAVCTKKMSDSGTLVRHFRHAHQEKKPFQCPKCGGFYSSEGTLWHHISNVHSDTRRIHKCEYCDASYDSSGAKTRHVHGTHHVKKPLFACPVPDCRRTFVFPAHLETHAAMDHDGFKPFQCRACLKSFSSANGLVRHAREVHRREKAYTCPLCSAGLTKRCHLKRHLLNVHHLSPDSVDEEMKRHPNPGDISVVVPTVASVGMPASGDISSTPRSVTPG